MCLHRRQIFRRMPQHYPVYLAPCRLNHDPEVVQHLSQRYFFHLVGSGLKLERRDRFQASDQAIQASQRAILGGSYRSPVQTS